MDPDESDVPPPTDVSRVDSTPAGSEMTLDGPSQSSSSGTWTSPPNLDAQSEASLRQASVALDAAYERITQLRTSINRLLNRVPPGSTQSPPYRGSEAGMGPDHSAIMLSNGELAGELNLRAERLRTLISPSARQRLEDFERTRMTRREPFQWERFLHGERPRYLRNDVPSFQTTTVSPLHSRSPPMPDLMVPGTRTSTQPRPYMRHELLGSDLDEASTTIGRRVAIRVAAGWTDDSRGTSQFRSLEQRLQAQTAQIAHELQNMTDRLIARRTGQLAVPTAAYGSTRHEPPHASLGPFPNDLAPPRHFRGVSQRTPLSRIGGVDVTTHPDPPPSSSGLLPTSSSAADAPGSDRTASGTPDVPVALPVFLDLDNPVEVRDRLRDLLARERSDRSTHPTVEVARRGNHNVNVSTGQSERTSSPQQQPGQTRRRRGWAHLDADGDEIVSDDDESPRTRRGRMYPSYPTAAEQLTARLGWRPPPGAEDVSETDTVFPEMCGDDAAPHSDACRLYPLPTTIEEMIVYPKSNQKRVRLDIPISRDKCLYGR